MNFENKVAFVTGATGALGSSVTLELLSNGASVAAAYRSESEMKTLVSKAAGRQSHLLGIQMDLTRGEDVERAVAQTVEKFGRLDFLVAVAGGFAAGKVWETDEKAWDQMFNLNLKSLYLVLRSAVPVMIRQDFGRIVTVSSASILRGGGPGIAAYAVSKTAVRQLSEILAGELKDYNIRVHSVLPGTMDTPANRRAMPNADSSKWVKTEEVARVIGTLLGDGLGPARSVSVPVP